MFLFASLGGYPKGECHAELKKTDKSLSQRVDAFHTGAKMGMPDDAPPNSGQAKIRQTALPTQTPTMVTETKRNQRIAFNAPSLSSNLVSFSRRPHPGDLGDQCWHRSSDDKIHDHHPHGNTETVEISRGEGSSAPKSIPPSLLAITRSVHPPYNGLGHAEPCGEAKQPAVGLPCPGQRDEAPSCLSPQAGASAKEAARA